MLGDLLRDMHLHGRAFVAAVPYPGVKRGGIAERAMQVHEAEDDDIKDRKL